MPTVTSLNNYQFAFNGYVFGGSDSVHQITEVVGLENLPEVRNQDDNRGYFDGMFTGRDFLGGRLIVINVQTLDGNGYSAQYNYNLLQAALQPQQSGTTPLQFQLSASNDLQYINARVRANTTVLDPDYTFGYIKSQITFYCADPRYYDNQLQSASTEPSNTLGRTYNRIYDLTYAGGASNGVALIQNNGWTTTYPTITINGPITNPIVGNYLTGEQLRINYAMVTSDVIVIDLLNRTVLLNGNPARNILINTSLWFAAPPGVNQFLFTGTGYTAGVTNCTIQWYSAYC